MHRPHSLYHHALLLILLLFLATAGSCGAPSSDSDRLQVVATTTIVGDVVGAIGGEHIDLAVLLPSGADPHAYEPTPQDAAAITDADVIFVNGLGLESFLDYLLPDADADERVVVLSEGIDPRYLEEGGAEHEHEDEEHGEEETIDPHVWFDPLNVVQWVHNAQQALGELDPAHVETYAARASQYEAELLDLDAWIAEQIERIPPQRRLLVTDHAVFGYLAERYGLQQVGTLLPGFSTLAEASAQEIAALQRAIDELGVPAIFVSSTINPSLAERVADDTGVEVVPLYTGSLSEPEGPATSYLELMRYNTTAIVEALR